MVVVDDGVDDDDDDADPRPLCAGCPSRDGEGDAERVREGERDLDRERDVDVCDVRDVRVLVLVDEVLLVVGEGSATQTTKQHTRTQQIGECHG